MDLSSLPIPFTREDAVAIGIGRLCLEEAVRSGVIMRTSRGLYVVSQQLSVGSERWERAIKDHVDRTRQQLRRFPGHVASHTSAAVLHGLAVTVSPSSPVEITAVDRIPRSRREPEVVLHHSDSHEIPVTEVDGLRATTVCRTLADTARHRRLPSGVAAIDDALRRGLVTQQQLFAELDRQRRWVGRPRALAALALADARRETWLESYSFVALHALAIPVPLPQVEIFDPVGTFVARVDGLLPESGVFLEADGQGKYFLGVSDTVGAEESVRTRLDAERKRHQRLESLGLRGVRWMADEIMTDADAVARRVNRATSRPPPEIAAYAVWNGERHRLPFEEPRLSVDMESLLARRPRRRRAA